MNTISPTWRKVRYGLYVFGFAAGLGRTFLPLQDPAGSGPAESSTTVLVVGSAAILLFIPLGLLGIVGLQAANPMSDKQWDPPRHDANPLYPRNPLFFFHGAGWFFAASGSGILAGTFWAGWKAFVAGLYLLLAATAVLAGVRLCMRVYTSKIRDSKA
jgi:hypothetical protein